MAEFKLTSDMIKAVILGHAVGDALGVPVEFTPRDELDKGPVTDMEEFGTYPVPAGSWSDDTSMTLCALESLSKGKLDLDEIMENFGKWYYEDMFTPTGETFDVGNTCSTAIENYFKKTMSVSECGLTGERSNGNGSLMRILPFALFSISKYGPKQLNKLWNTVALGSSLTHNHIRSTIACQIYATILSCILLNAERNGVLTGIALHKQWNEWGSEEYEHFKRIDYEVLRNLKREDIRSSGYVIDSFEAALWCFITTGSYKECVLKAVNLGDDTDTIAAIAGGLAGAQYGLEGIPKEWLSVLKRRDYIEYLCDKSAEKWNSVFSAS